MKFVPFGIALALVGAAVPCLANGDATAAIVHDFTRLLLKNNIHHEAPSGCVQWESKRSRHGNTIMHSRVSQDPRCRDVHVNETWIVPNSGGDPYRVDGKRHTPISQLRQSPPPPQRQQPPPQQQPQQRQQPQRQQTAPPSQKSQPDRRNDDHDRRDGTRDQDHQNDDQQDHRDPRDR